MLALPDFQLHTVEQVLELLLSLQWKDEVITLTEEQVELLTCLDIKPGGISRVEAEDKITINTPELSLSSCPLWDADFVDSVEEHMDKEHECTGTNTKDAILPQTLTTLTLNQPTQSKNINQTQNHIPSVPAQKDVNKAIQENVLGHKVTKVPHVNIINTKVIIPISNVDKTIKTTPSPNVASPLKPTSNLHQFTSIIPKCIKPTLDKSNHVPETIKHSLNVASPALKTIATTQPVSIPTPKLTALTTEVTSLIPAQTASMVNIAHTVKCPMCSRTFGGTNCRKKNKLKCHIGKVHYGQKIKEDIERLFEVNKCTVCMKDFVNFENKRKHIIWKHCKYVDEIQSTTNKAMKANDIVSKNMKDIVQNRNKKPHLFYNDCKYVDEIQSKTNEAMKASNNVTNNVVKYANYKNKDKDSCSYLSLVSISKLIEQSNVSPLKHTTELHQEIASEIQLTNTKGQSDNIKLNTLKEIDNTEKQTNESLNTTECDENSDKECDGDLLRFQDELFAIQDISDDEETNDEDMETDKIETSINKNVERDQTNEKDSDEERKEQKDEMVEEQVELLTYLDIKPGEISRVEAEDKVTINTPEWCTIPITKDIMQSFKENVSESIVTTMSNIKITMSKETIPTPNVGKAATKAVLPSIQTITTTQPVSIPTPKLAASTTEVTSSIPAQPAYMMNIAHTVKCPMCSKTFGGSQKKDKLKSHIGNVHYGRKIKEEIERLFEGNKCTVCMKDVVEIVNKKRHLVYNHSKYVQEIQSATNEAMKARDIVTKNIVNETNCEKKEGDVRPSDLRLVPLAELTEQRIVSTSKPTSNLHQFTSTIRKLIQPTLDKSNQVPETIKQSSNVASPDLKTITTTQPVSIPTPKLAVSTTEVTSLILAQPASMMKNVTYKVKCPMCSETCDVNNTKDALKNHIGNAHYGRKFKEEIKRLFKGNKCTVCMNLFIKIANKRKHLIYNHSKYVEEIQSATNDAIKKHIVNVHYGWKIKKEINRLFEGSKCTVCMKDFVKIGNKRNHLVYNHSKYVEEIQYAINDAMKASNIVTKNVVNDANHGETKDEYSPSNLSLVSISKHTEHSNVSPVKHTTELHQEIINFTHTVKCPMCSRTFGGSLKFNLKSHIGNIHYGQKIKKEIERLFEGNKCTVCMKDFVDMGNKKKHLINKHSKYVEEIQSATNEAMIASQYYN